MESLKPDSILSFYEVFAILVVLISLYFTAVKKGIEQLKSLTVLLIVVMVITIRLYFTTLFQICRLLPTTNAVDLDLFMSICLLVLWMAGSYWKDNRGFFVLLYTTWGLFLVICLSIILQNLNLYIRWTLPLTETVLIPGKSDQGSTLHADPFVRQNYLINSLKAALWLTFCVIVLIRTRSEQRRVEA